MSHPLSLSTAIFAAIVLGTGPVLAQTVSGTIDKIENDGRSITIGGTVVEISGSRTNICIAGVCDQGRNKLKPGMICAAEVTTRDGRPEARRLSCK